jgi:hypothetical protein
MSIEYATTIVNLQQRVSYLENTVGYLMSEVQRLSQNKVPLSQGFQTSIPLQPTQPIRRPYVPRIDSAISSMTPSMTSSMTPQPMVQRFGMNDETAAPVLLSEILHQGEDVTFGIHTGRDEIGNLSTSTVIANFDGTVLTVTECADIPSLVGFKSAKAGGILFKFMNALKAANIIQRTFNALPWRLTSVVRDGQRITLSQLRQEKQGTPSE